MYSKTSGIREMGETSCPDTAGFRILGIAHRRLGNIATCPDTAGDPGTPFPDSRGSTVYPSSVKILWTLYESRLGRNLAMRAKGRS